MTKIRKIQQSLKGINQAKFQQLCDSYIYKKFGFSDIKTMGSVIAKEKTSKGTPDTAFKNSEEKYILAEYTTQENRLLKKLIQDLEACLDETKTKISLSDVERIFLCHNFKLSAEDDNSLIKMGREKRVAVQIIDISTLSYDLFLKFPKLAFEFLGVEVDTGQILEMSDFIAEYEKNKFATRLDTAFHFRAQELSNTLQKLDEKEGVIIVGKPGVGKSRLALETINQFQEKHTDFKTYCVFNKQGVSLFNDLKDYFSNDGKYLIFVDDANRVAEIEHIFRLLSEKTEGKEFRIIVTVRDYALDKVRQYVRNYDYEEVILEPFEDKELKEFVSSEFPIKHHRFIERIAKIAKGNPRIAVMAAESVSKTKDFECITNVEGIYDEYFSSISKDLESLKSQDLLKVAGLISFFRVIKLNDKEFLQSIQKSFEIDEDIIKESLVRLHEMEVVELYENEIAKISEQVLATYLFYKVFFKDGLLNFFVLLRDYFETHQNLLIDSVYPAYDAFDRDLIKKRLQPAIDNMWSEIEVDDKKLLDFIDTFFPFKETQSLLFLKRKIKSLDARKIDLDELSFESRKNRGVNDRYLRTIKLFRQASPEAFQTSLELFFSYLEKRSELVGEVLCVLEDDFCFSPYSDMQGYRFETILIEKLIEKIEDGNNQELYSKLFLAVARHFLKMSFRSTSSSGIRQIQITTFGLLPCDEVFTIRQKIWNTLFELFENEEYEAEVVNAISIYSHGWNENNTEAIAKEDAKYVLRFIESKLEPEKLRHCYAVQDYLFYLEKVKLPINKELRTKFSSESYEISQIVFDKHFRIYDEVGYDKWNERKAELLDKKLGNNTFADYERFFDICEEILSIDDREQLNGTVFQILLDLSERDVDLFVQVLNDMFAKKNPLGFYSFQTPVLIRKLIETIGTPNECYQFLQRHNYKQKEMWLSCFFSFLKPSEIDKRWVSRLIKFYQNSSLMIVDLQFLRNYRKVDKDIVLKIVRILLKRSTESDFKFSFHCMFSSDFENDFDDIFSESVDLLKHVYFYQFGVFGDSDYLMKAFQKIFALDESFLFEYLDSIYEKCKGFISTYDRGEDFTFIWERENFEEILNAVIDFCLEKEKNIFHGTILKEFFIKREGDSKELNNRKKDFIVKFVENNAEDISKTSFIFQVVADFGHEDRKDCIAVFLKKNHEFKDFQELSIEPLSGGWTGSAVPYYQKKVDYLESLLPLLKGFIFIEHRNLIEKSILRYRNNIQDTLKKEFVESAFE